MSPDSSEDQEQQNTFEFLGVLARELPDERSTAAQREVSVIATAVVNAIAALEPPPERGLRLEVILASDIEPHVDAMNVRFGKPDGQPYKAKGEAGQAEGIAVFGGAAPDPVQVVLIINHEKWLADDARSLTLRWFLTFHELMHVVQRVHGDGANHEEFDVETSTYEENVQYQARVAYDEYEADLKADGLCRQFLSADGVGVGGSEYLLNEYAGAVATILERVGQFVSAEVVPYRYMSIGSFEQLGSKAHLLLRELFRLLAHSVGLAQAVDSFDGLTKALEPLVGFAEYIGEDWSAFVDALQSGSGDAAEPELSRVWNAILKRMGFIFDNTDEGQLHIHVVDPVLCELPEDELD